MPLIGIDQAPILEMHIRIPDQRAKNQPAKKLGDTFFADFGPDHFSDISVAGTLILPFRLNPEYLREILNMDHPTLFRPVAALEVVKAPFKGMPIIEGDFSGDIEATLDISGLHGTVATNFAGYSALKGNVSFGLQPEACISIPTLGNACTRL